MEGELWEAVYRLILEEASKLPRRKRVKYCDAWVLGVFFWAVVHDRPMCWACNGRNWPDARLGCLELPSDARMSQRLRTLSVLQLLAAVLDRLASLAPPSGTLVRAVDGKPLPVGGYSKDRDAHWGKSAADGWEKGYKMFDVWAEGVVPDAWTLGPMDEPEPTVARQRLLPQLAATGAGGYLLGDALFDSNPLHEACAPQGIQLVAPRKKPGTGLGHRDHSPSRLRSIDLLESTPPGDLPAAGRRPFARELYEMRSNIERRLGNLCGFGGGLAPLPAWVRTPCRVARWVAAKLVINGLRQCRMQGLTA
jgi:Transposase DDE domain